MAVDMFLKFDPGKVKGESQDAKHTGEIDIFSFSFAAHQTGTSNVGGGSGAGRVSLQDVTVTKKVDAASPTLFQLCCSGEHIGPATIPVRKAGGEAVEYMIVDLGDVMISGYQQTGSDGQDQLMEQVTINFKQAGVVYTPQLDDGTAGSKDGLGWDAAKNEKWDAPSA